MERTRVFWIDFEQNYTRPILRAHCKINKDGGPIITDTFCCDGRADFEEKNDDNNMESFFATAIAM